MYLYTENNDGTINYYGEGSHTTLQSFIETNSLQGYKFTDTEPVMAQGKYWLDAANNEYLAAKELDDKARAEAEKNKEPTVIEQLAQLQADFNIMSEALDSLIMDESTDAESSSSDSNTTTSN